MAPSCATASGTPPVAPHRSAGDVGSGIDGDTGTSQNPRLSAHVCPLYARASKGPPKWRLVERSGKWRMDNRCHPCALWMDGWTPCVHAPCTAAWRGVKPALDLGPLGVEPHPIAGCGGRTWVPSSSVLAAMGRVACRSLPTILPGHVPPSSAEPPRGPRVPSCLGAVALVFSPAPRQSSPSPPSLTQPLNWTQRPFTIGHVEHPGRSA